MTEATLKTTFLESYSTLQFGWMVLFRHVKIQQAFEGIKSAFKQETKEWTALNGRMNLGTGI